MGTAYGICTMYPDAAPVTGVYSAGTVSITGANQSISMPWQDAGYYVWNEMLLPAVSGGETLVFAGTGDTIPAFSGQVTAPATAVITSPPEPFGTITLNRSTPFALSWTGGGAGNLVIGFYDGSQTLECRLPAEAGQGAIPSASLMAMHPGNWLLNMYVFNQAFVQQIWLQASNTVVWSLDRSMINAMVNVQ